jgi:hypothetical protein
MAHTSYPTWRATRLGTLRYRAALQRRSLGSCLNE